MLAMNRRAISLGIITIACRSSALAGPYFETYQTDVDAQSREAVGLLSDARAAVINMFDSLDEGHLVAASGQRNKALDLLSKSKSMFQDIAEKVGSRKIRLVPSTDDEKLILLQFRAALEKRKLPFPVTEHDLATLAVTVVRDYAETIAKADLKGFPKNWRGVREIILSEIDLLYIGNLASIVWVISRENS